MSNAENAEGKMRRLTAEEFIARCENELNTTAQDMYGIVLAARANVPPIPEPFEFYEREDGELVVELEPIFREAVAKHLGLAPKEN